jgi:hypothetical protein
MHPRRVIVALVIAALAASNLVAPRPSYAAMHPHLTAPAPVAAKHHQHLHHHHAATHDADAAPCTPDDTADHATFKPGHTCCLATCAAMAFIFAAIDVVRRLPADDFHWPLTRVLRPSALMAIDHPPRKS